MRYLIDTNVLIPLEPTSTEFVEAGTKAAAELLRVLTEAGHHCLIHPASLVDLERDRDEARRDLRRLLVVKYRQLEQPPPVARIESELGTVVERSNDWVDHSLLTAVYANAVDILVTEDLGLLAKARRVGVATRVMTVDDALLRLGEEQDRQLTTPPPPEALEVPLHNLDLIDPLFESLRADYPLQFDAWFERCAREGRRAFVVPASDSPLRCAGLCVVKHEFDNEFGFGARAVKVSTFKVADEFVGNRFGELLLKALFRYCHDRHASQVWLTVFDHHVGLIGLLDQFGFVRSSESTDLGEGVYVKELVPPVTAAAVEPLEFHVTYGPPAVRLQEARTFLVPIQPRFHALLFPDAEREPTLAVEARPFGCAIRKAYLCHSPTRSLAPGDTLLFYRSHTHRGVGAVGVVEETFVSCDADEIGQRVGTRTVYSPEEIRQLAKRDVLVILFRHDRVLTDPIPEGELTANGVIGRPPQSIMRARSGSAAWLVDRIGA